MKLMQANERAYINVGLHEYSNTDVKRIRWAKTVFSSSCEQMVIQPTNLITKGFLQILTSSQSTMLLLILSKNV
jgi:hypothetical protein